MKTTLSFLALMTLCVHIASAQDSKGGAVDLQAPKKEKEEKKAAVTPTKPPDELLGKKVVYGGFLTELARAEKKRPLLSLKNPIDPKKDFDNLWIYPGTDRIQGVVFFSIKF